MPTDTTQSPPRDFLSFPGCKTCRGKPCSRLRFGRVFPGKFIVIHRRYLGFGEKGCPFVVTSKSEAVELFRHVPLPELTRYVNDILSDMSPSEQSRTMMRHFVDGFADASGRVDFLSALWDNNVLGVIRVPRFFTMDKPMTRWLLAHQALDLQLDHDLKEAPDDQAAVTDAMASKPAEAAPENKDEDKKEPAKKGPFHIRLNIDPNDPDSQDDTFTMFSTDQAKSYNKTLTVKDDQVPGDSYTDLSFTDLDTSLSYSMKIDLGNGGQSYLLIENMPYGELHG